MAKGRKPQADHAETLEGTWAEGYDVVGAALSEKGHSHNWDAMGWTVFGGETRSLALMVVCDGVSSSPQGGDASHTAVDAMVAWAKRQAASDEPMEEMLSLAVQSAHAEVADRLQGRGICTLVAALVDRQARRFAYASIGDSLVCLLDGTGFRKANGEDCAVRLRMMNKEVVYSEGIPLIDRGLTQALGQLDPVDAEIRVVDYSPGDCLALASDGVLAPWLEEALRHSGRTMAAADALRFCQEMRNVSRDDTTFLLIRLGETEPICVLRRGLENWAGTDATGRESLLGDVTAHAYRPAALLRACLAAEADDDRAVRLVKALEESPTRLGVDEWKLLLDAAARAGRRRLAMRLEDVVRRQLVR